VLRGDLLLVGLVIGVAARERPLSIFLILGVSLAPLLVPRLPRTPPGCSRRFGYRTCRRGGSVSNQQCLLDARTAARRRSKIATHEKEAPGTAAATLRCRLMSSLRARRLQRTLAARVLTAMRSRILIRHGRLHAGHPRLSCDKARRGWRRNSGLPEFRITKCCKSGKPDLQ
jgi:hypothetical protein